MAFKLFTTYYEERRQTRRAELGLCLEVNCAAFDFLHVVGERVGPPAMMTKGTTSVCCQRQKFADLLQLARENADEHDLVVIANCDMLIPRSSLLALDTWLDADEAYCLTRWELSTMRLWDVGYSQDVWAFRGPPKENIGGDYWFGVPGCDNRLSWELAQAGYKTQNPSRSVATWHLHGTRQRTVTNSEPHRVPPPYLYLMPVEFGQEQPRIEAKTMAERHKAFTDRRRSRVH